MNSAHFHLMFNHLSLVGLGFAILFSLVAILRNNAELMKLSCWFYVLVALLSLPAIITGDGAGEIIRTYPGISNDLIEQHETWAYVFFYGLIVIGAGSLASLWFSRKNIQLLKKINIVVLILSIFLLFFAYQTGSTGGKIKHPEIEHGMLKNN